MPDKIKDESPSHWVHSHACKPSSQNHKIMIRRMIRSENVISLWLRGWASHWWSCRFIGDRVLVLVLTPWLMHRLPSHYSWLSSQSLFSQRKIWADTLSGKNTGRILRIMRDDLWQTWKTRRRVQERPHLGWLHDTFLLPKEEDPTEMLPVFTPWLDRHSRSILRFWGLLSPWFILYLNLQRCRNILNCFTVYYIYYSRCKQMMTENQELLIFEFVRGIPAQKSRSWFIVVLIGEFVSFLRTKETLFHSQLQTLLSLAFKVQK